MNERFAMAIDAAFASGKELPVEPTEYSRHESVASVGMRQTSNITWILLRRSAKTEVWTEHSDGMVATAE
jgi:hypothetical protein